MTIIYILTNEYMPDVIKVGITGNLKERMRTLDTTGTPLPFECFYAVEVADDVVAREIEAQAHEALDNYRIRSKREFFKTTPEKARAMLKIAEKMGGKEVMPGDDVVENTEDKQALDEAKKMRTKFKFSMLDIVPGEILQFKKDKSITCEVVDDSDVKFNGDSKVKFGGDARSLTALADIILKDMGIEWSAAGTFMWCKDGKTLYDLRKENES